jgi:small redox-active disulfide protein 2
MTTLEILGTGCAKCLALAAVTEEAARALGLAYRLGKVTSIAEITKRGVMITPALVVDGVVKCAGRVPTLEQVKALLAPAPPPRT